MLLPPAWRPAMWMAAAAAFAAMLCAWAAGDAECDTAVDDVGNLAIACRRCRVVSAPLWHDAALAVMCASGAIAAAYAAAVRDKWVMRWAGGAALAFAVVTGSAALLTAMQLPVLGDAADAVRQREPDCAKIADMMSHAAGNRALFATLVAAALLGAAWDAMTTYESLDYEEVGSQNFRAVYEGRL